MANYNEQYWQRFNIVQGRLWCRDIPERYIILLFVHVEYDHVV